MMKTEIKIYKEILQAEGAWAAETREMIKKHKIIMLNLIGSPGCGKTALLEVLLPHLVERLRCAVLEGDVETARDAERLKNLGIPVSQIITQGTCHLGAQIVNKAVQELPLRDLDLIFVENVGNLICPTVFDIGETCKLAVLSVTEGEDKPLKYPLLFREAKALVLTKIDLLPYLPFDRTKCLEYISGVNGELTVFEISAFKKQGITAFAEWISSLETE
jgi:hydrogenase nickel incorporation protein HypB